MFSTDKPTNQVDRKKVSALVHWYWWPLLALTGCGGGGGSSEGIGTNSPHPVSSQADLYSVGGSVEGLSGSGLLLTNNGSDTVSPKNDGRFAFPTKSPDGAKYQVTITKQPLMPAQTCTVDPGNGQGSIAKADITTVKINCVTNAYLVGGSVKGLKGKGLVLQLDEATEHALMADGDFQFAPTLKSGTPYNVTIRSNPSDPAQTCTMSGGTGKGTVGASNISDISVICSTNTYTVNGTVNGLAGAGLVLQNNGADDVPVPANGGFSFVGGVASGSSYNVTVKTQPSAPPQTCTVNGGVGLVTARDITAVSVSCSTNTYSVGGSVNGLLGSGLVLQNNGSDDTPVTANGNFTFGTGVVSSARYNVTVRAQPKNPSQTCSVSSGASGTVFASNVTGVAVTCSTNSYTVGGTVNGLIGSGLVLQNNAGDDISVTADGKFDFSTPVASNSNYAVTVKTQPLSPRQHCVVSNAAGGVAGGAITNINVSCTTSVGRLGFSSYGPSSLSLGDMDGMLASFTINSGDGSLKNSGPTTATGKRPSAVAISPSGLFAYVVNDDPSYYTSHGPNGYISSYSVDPVTGALKANGPTITAGRGPVAVTVHPSGKFIYVVNRDESSVSVFSVNALTGRLTAIGTPIPAGLSPRTITLNQAGTFAYVTNWWGKSITVFSINPSTGNLSSVAEVPSDGFPYAVAVHPSGKFVYSANMVGNTSVSGVRSYSVDAASGALTLLNAVITGVNPRTLAVHPSGMFAYVANDTYQSTGTISVFPIDATGRIQPMTQDISTGRGDFCLTIDPSGKYAYLSNFGTSGYYVPVVWVYSIDTSTGAMSRTGSDINTSGCMTVW